MTAKTIISTATSNVVGTIVGGVALYFVAKKLVKVENKYAVIGMVLVGAFIGSIAQSKMHSKAALATASKVTVTSPSA